MTASYLIKPGVSDSTHALSVEDALGRMLAAISPMGLSEQVRTMDACGRVLAKEVFSTIDVPPGDNSTMDGYAVRISDMAGVAGVVLPISQRIAAGRPGTPLRPGSAARIFTGAPIPHGADAVVMQERCEPISASNPDVSLGEVRINELPVAGAAIRRRGEDVARGRAVLRAGRRLDAAAIGLAATVGASRLEVAARPRVALFSTGDELAMPGEPLPDGAIYDSNRFMLAALLQDAGCVVSDLGKVPDRLNATRAMLRDAAAAHDLILSSGGVSVGEEDHLKSALATEGRLDIWSIAIKPGKPLAFGAVARTGGETRVIGLPGNPVASFVTFALFVRPVVARLQGMSFGAPMGVRLRADFSWPRPDKRRQFLRVRRNAQGGLELFGNQGSGVLTSLVWCDGLADVAPGQVVSPGDMVDYLSLAELGA